MERSVAKPQRFLREGASSLQGCPCRGKSGLVVSSSWLSSAALRLLGSELTVQPVSCRDLRLFSWTSKVLQHMKAIQSEQDRQRQRKLQAERGKHKNPSRAVCWGLVLIPLTCPDLLIAI